MVEGDVEAEMAPQPAIREQYSDFVSGDAETQFVILLRFGATRSRTRLLAPDRQLCEFQYLSLELGTVGSQGACGRYGCADDW